MRLSLECPNVCSVSLQPDATNYDPAGHQVQKNPHTGFRVSGAGSGFKGSGYRVSRPLVFGLQDMNV